MRELLLPRILFALPQHGRLRNVIATVAVATVVVAGASLIPNGGTPVTPPGPGTANIWIDSNGGTCQRLGTAGSYVDATACGTFDAANDICQSGDLVYVKTATAYPGEAITGSNGRSSACTIEAEPSTSDIQFSGDVAIGSSGGDGPDWLTIKHVQCGSSTTSFTNEVELFVWDNSNNDVLDDWDCASFDAFGVQNFTIQNSDFGPCGSSATRKCVSRIAPGTAQPNNGPILIQDTTFHDIWCGTGSASECNLYHTDGMAVFGSDSVTLRRVKFYKNDITNIRFQNNTSTGRANTNVVIENSWFGAPCSTTAGTNCTGGSNANAFDIDNQAASFTVRFSSFAQDTRPQCNSGTGQCGTSTNPAVFLGNIYSTNASFCSYTQVTRSYNAENHWNGSGDSVCSGTGNNMGANVGYVQGTGTINFHLSGTNNADNLVTTGCIATDIDSQTRAATSCDAGSDER